MSVLVAQIITEPIPEVVKNDICYIDFPAASFPIKSLGLGAPDRITIPFTNHGFFLVFKWTNSRITFIFKLVGNELQVWSFYREQMSWKESWEMRKQIWVEHFRTFVPEPLQEPKPLL